MTVSTPPRPPRPSDPVTHDELQALVEALIEEARQRARKRHQRYALVVFVGVAVAAVVGFSRADTGASNPAAARESGTSAAVGSAVNGKIAFEGSSSRRSVLQVVNPDGSGLKTIEQCPATQSGCVFFEPAWSPGGKRIAFVRGHEGGATTRSTMSLFATDAHGQNLRQLTACGSCGQQYGGRLGWSPGGNWIAFSRTAGPTGEQSLWIIAAGGGKARRLTRCSATQCVDVDPVWSPNGRLIAFSRSSGRSVGLYTVRPDGSQLTTIAAGADPQWSPDGQRIAFDGNDELGVVNADGSGHQVLYAGTRGSGPGVPSWSPDGTKLVYFNTPGTPGHFVAEVWTMNPDGSAKTRLYRSPCCVGVWGPPIWSPDGRMIAFSADPAGGTLVMDADGSALRRLSKFTSYDLSWQQLPGH